MPLPAITPWTVSIYKAPTIPKASTFHGFKQRVVSVLGVEKDSEDFEDYSEAGVDYLDGAPSYSFAQITSKGDISATYLILGPVAVPSDGQRHNFTIRDFDLFGNLSWALIPKLDTRMRLTVSHPQKAWIWYQSQSHQEKSKSCPLRRSRRVSRRNGTIRDGLLKWVCLLPPQKKLNLHLHWEV